MRRILSVALSRYSVAWMRVDVAFELDERAELLEIPWKNAGPAHVYLDLRRGERLVEQLEPARRHAPLRSFLISLNSPDSFFATSRSKTWLQPASLPEGVALDDARYEFASRVELVFATEELNFERQRYQLLTERLRDLLARESGEAVRAELRVRPCQFLEAGRAGYCLRVLLYALGGTPEQAELRWGLGLAQLQQALLFLSRALRQQLARDN